MTIHTSRITTEQDGDLSIDPNGTGEVKLTKLANQGETPLSVNNDGEIGKLDNRDLTLLETVEGGDLISIQRGDDFFRVDADEFVGGGIADPTLDNVSWIPTTPPGSGTLEDPFVLTAGVASEPGGTTDSIEQMALTGLRPGAQVLITEQGGTSGLRFEQGSKFTDEQGVVAPFPFVYTDTPASVGGQVYEGLIRVGSSIYVKWDVTQVANLTVFAPKGQPTASPSTVDYVADEKFGTVTGTWADGSRTLEATNVVFNVDGGTLDDTNKFVTDGSTVGVAFVDGVVAAAAEGDVITGTLASTDGTFYLPVSMVKDTTPANYTFAPITNAPASTEATTGLQIVPGFNAPTTLSAVGGTSALTNIEVSVNGAARVPASSVTVNPGDTIQLYGTTGGADNTAYTADVSIGGVVASWSVTTVVNTVTPAIGQPSILSPIDGSADLVPDVIVTSSTYVPLNGAGSHSASTWEVYEAGGAALETSVITSSNDQIAPIYENAALERLIDAANLFDGDVNTSALADGPGAYVVLLNTTINNVSTLEILDNVPSSQTYYLEDVATTFTVGSSAGISGGVWKSIDSPPSTVTKISTVWTSGTGRYFAIRVNGVILESGAAIGTILTLTDDTNLTRLAAGDAVLQDAGYTPQTSAITGTAQENVAAQMYVGRGLVGTTNIKANGTLYVPGTNLNDDDEIYVIATGAEEIGADFCSVAGTAYYLTLNWYDAAGNVVRTMSGSHAPGEWRTLSYERDYSLGGFTINANAGEYTKLKIYNGGGTAGTPTEFTSTQLTLTNDTDLANFREGDEVEQDSGGEPSYNNGGASTNWPFKWGTSSASYVAMPNNQTVVSNDVVTVNRSAQTYGLNHNAFTAPWGLSFKVLSADADTELVIRRGGSGDTFDGLGTGAEIYRGTGSFAVGDQYPAGSYYYVSAVGPTATSSVDVIIGGPITPSGTVFAIGSNTLSLTGGNSGWSAGTGNYAIGPDTTPATGTIGSVDVGSRTISLSTSDESGSKRWISNGNRKVVVPSRVGGPGAPTTEPPDAGVYTQITPSATTLTSATLDDSNLQEDKWYYSRVQYTDSSTLSPFSSYNEFSTAASFVPGIGGEYAGGYFGGQINISGTIYNLIVCPRGDASGLEGQAGPDTWSSVNADGSSSFDNETYGGGTSQTLSSDAQHPMFQWLASANGPNAGTFDITGASNGSGIGGYNDWYIPAKYELEVLYYYLKPDSTSNFTLAPQGANPYAVAPEPVNTPYSTSTPGQTTVALFVNPQPQSFLPDKYWSASQYASNRSGAWSQGFDNGSMDPNPANKASNALFRAIRRLPA